MVKPTGFPRVRRALAVRQEINLMGVQALGLGLGTLIHELGVKPELITAHDFRGYSASIKMALITGLMSAGIKVKDIGLAVTPMAYFAQFDLDVPCVAMVTASHNDNGWTGVKMGANRPLTFGPDEMTRLKEIVLERGVQAEGRRHLRLHRRVSRALHRGPHQPAEDQAQAEGRVRLRQRHRGRVSPRVLEAIGCEVIPLDCELDHTFPNYNPNTEDMKMLHAMRDAVLKHKADVALGFDGDGDRCGVVDNTGDEIFADKWA
jgi:phosphomannomutase/phosphoglucomutase